MRKWAIVLCELLLASGLAALPQEDRGKDGRYHDPTTGEAQPDTCDNSFKNTHPCRCNRATSCDPKEKDRHPSPNPNDPSDMSPRCQTWCRTKACGCLSPCGS